MTNPLMVIYTNWRGETRLRILSSPTLWFGSTEHHPAPQWFIRAEDADRPGTVRDFALLDCDFRGASNGN